MISSTVNWNYTEQDGDADNSDNDDEIPIITIESSEPCFPDYSSHTREVTHHTTRRQNDPNKAFLWRQRTTKPYNNGHDSFQYDSPQQRLSGGHHKRNSTRSKRFMNRAPKYADRWTKLQTDVLIKNWKENFNAIKTSKAKTVWMEIAQRVNEVDKGQLRTVPQCKDKIRNLIAKYKRVKGSNRTSDYASKLLEYFDDIDSVLVNVHMATLTGDKSNEFEEGFNHHEMTTATNEERINELDTVLGNQDLIRVPIPELPKNINATHCNNIVVVVEPSSANIDAVNNNVPHSVASSAETNYDFTPYIRKNDGVEIKTEEKICEIGRVMSSRDLMMVKQPLKNIDAFNPVFQNPEDVVAQREIKASGATSSSLLGSSSMSESDGENYTSIKPPQKTSSETPSRANISKVRLQRNRKSKFEDLLDVQRSLIQSFERSNERHYDFLKNMIEEQRQIDANERQKDRDFFLALAKTFASKQ